MLTSKISNRIFFLTPSLGERKSNRKKTEISIRITSLKIFTSPMPSTCVKNTEKMTDHGKNPTRKKIDQEPAFRKSIYLIIKLWECYLGWNWRKCWWDESHPRCSNNSQKYSCESEKGYNLNPGNSKTFNHKTRKCKNYSEKNVLSRSLFCCAAHSRVYLVFFVARKYTIKPRELTFYRSNFFLF